MERGRKLDETLIRYLKSIISVLLTLVLVLAILDIFGIKTTSFAALLAGAGLAIGTAWGGLLTHFAAGVFMQVLRPFKVGDFVQAGGVTGTVHEVGLFGTTIITPDNVMTIVGNNKVFSESIQNFTTLPFRRVDCVAKVANSVDPLDAIARLKASIAMGRTAVEKAASVPMFTVPVFICVRSEDSVSNRFSSSIRRRRVLIDSAISASRSRRVRAICSVRCLYSTGWSVLKARSSSCHFKSQIPSRAARGA